ncbi:uncharacterized protein TRIADDRAFT_59110 [Trichoplax adhaerens]|uniref:ADP-ribosylation factor-like protein 6-interacting protein 4 n=1 Tax=Trichoplax adhaerens TaxID=10228 RepID=B3S4J7_TRIAD|nr:hypothetical protein TRIADDRAFT_59110 [Trichoplax adhaerens]EDV22645.1 hypothetical protein TRIADDRAFT_59110 [Trichoplax adhaerens]|eukprot:XP_002115189.1 hypothetical protein TRIADDRAFT_59110 [Trichoplax adhaerens]
MSDKGYHKFVLNPKNDGQCLNKNKRKHSSEDSHEKKKHSKKKSKKNKKDKKSAKKEKRKDKKYKNSQDADDAAAKTSQKDASTGPVEQQKNFAPMTKEEWDKQQSVIRRVYDPETGRNRLIKGSGEILEEIVSKEQHQRINKVCLAN